jgi:hypothetical protein
MRVFGRVDAQSSPGQCKNNVLLVYAVAVAVSGGAREWGRTITALRPPDFESGASASSATRAREQDSISQFWFQQTKLCKLCIAGRLPLDMATKRAQSRFSFPRFFSFRSCFLSCLFAYFWYLGPSLAGDRVLLSLRPGQWEGER